MTEPRRTSWETCQGFWTQVRQKKEDPSPLLCQLHRYCTENWEKIFPEKKLRGLSPNFYIHISVSKLYIPTINLPIFGCKKIGGPILGIYKSLTDVWLWKLGTRPVWRLPVSLANLRQRVVKIYFPPPLDVTRRTQRSQNSGEQQSMSRASSSWWFIISRNQESTRSTITTVARLLWTGLGEPARRAKQHYITGYI
jgi:hypothetical protein